MVKLDNKRVNEEYGDVIEFDVLLDNDYTVDELITAIVARNRGKGYITVKSRDAVIKLRRCEYVGNKIIKNTIDSNDLSRMVDTVKAIKFEGNTNYVIETYDY